MVLLTVMAEQNTQNKLVNNNIHPNGEINVQAIRIGTSFSIKFQKNRPVIKTQKVKINHEFLIMNKQFLNFLNFFKIGVVKNFVTFTGKHLCWSLFLITLQVTKLAINIPEWCRRRSGVFIVNFEACNFIKRRLQHRCFPMKFEKFSRTPFLQNTSGGYFCI